MANTKQKQEPEGANRRPGKSRFSIPEKEAPPIDGSYLDRLFADYEKQSQEQEAGRSTAHIAPASEVTHPKGPAASEEIRPHRTVEFSGDDTFLLEKLKKKHRLGKGEVKVLRAMLSMCRNAGVDYCFVKIPRLMADSGLKERQTQLVLRSLRELGLIERIAEYSNVDRLGTKYRLILE